ncbi:MAG TPA: glycosyltransferase family 2 protein [Woeseiaceae bacterium]|nr:glycosyltransferase family 2 protein [Woeseiaceae bacterium]
MSASAPLPIELPSAGTSDAPAASRHEQPQGPQLSVVIPAYNECGNLEPLLDEIEHALHTRLRYEVIVVDDGSTDGSAAELALLATERQWLKCERHGRNRGQSAAIHRGVKAARAPIVAVLDGDGQNDPADIPKLFATLALSGCRMAIGERRRRQDTWLRRASSRIANTVRAALLGDGVSDTGCGLKLFYRRDFLELPAFDHMHRFLPALVQMNGGTVRCVPVNHRQRRSGTSKYGVRNRLAAGIVDLAGVLWLKRRRW